MVLSGEIRDNIFGNNNVNNFHNTFLRCFNACFPRKELNNGSNKNMWLTKGIELLIVCRYNKDPNLETYYES
jgi:hypothetical protein